MEFIPDQRVKAPGLAVPYFEDIRAADAPGYSTRKTQAELQGDILNLIIRLGGGFVEFIPGKYPTSPPRHGFRVQFSLNGVAGRMDIAALPMRSETAVKKDKAMRQALFLLRDWLQAEVYSAVYRPGAVALIPFLLSPGGEKTVTEMLLDSGTLPQFAGYLPPINGKKNNE